MVLFLPIVVHINANKKTTNWPEVMESTMNCKTASKNMRNIRNHLKLMAILQFQFNSRTHLGGLSFII
ncbi:hypothetical protein DERP_005843 [Dermatophagoides pteronyssinus]|uniref:Uncharacterized protein n=1 Tax=Dermatophagoides pteronyssinus TaxID=6956 RepID=A0ABQ8J9P8_DERPT|nr:hypothetical protein DERP_005843 [Dermatophagoides pteronyssinus]